MNNPLRILAPKAQLRPYNFLTHDGRTIVVMISWFRPLIGKPRAAVFWRRGDDPYIREELITCLGMWTADTLNITDLRQVRFFGFRRGEIGSVGQFKVIGAHRRRGDLFPVFVPPLAFLFAIKPAFDQLHQEATKQRSEAADA